MSTSQGLKSFQLTVVKNLGDEPLKSSIHFTGFIKISGEKAT
jgi:hypothetical protein